MKLKYFFILIIILGVTNFCKGPSEIKYIFLITLDTTRADHINYSLKDNDLTPNLANLASKGMYFKNAFSLIPITLPSHANMFYSLPPHKIKVYNNGNFIKTPRDNVVQILKKNGFSTNGIISLGVLQSEFGLNSGFDEVSEEFANGFFYKDAKAVNAEVFKLLEKSGNEKEFFWVHYSDPHSPYFPPEYKGGEFRIIFNKDTVYTCESTDYKKVNIEILLAPGENFLSFKTKIPKAIKKNRNIRIYTTSLIDFRLIPENPNNNYEVIFPDDWNKKIEKNILKVGTPRRRSHIKFINRTKKIFKLNISFVYRMIETISSSGYLYRKSIRFLDEQIGKLIKHLKKKGIYKNSAFVVVGDHGEGLGEFKKEVGHVNFLNGLFTRIPLIISGNGVKKMKESSIPVTTLEIAPAILKLAGINKPSHMIGENIFELKKKRLIFLETYSPEAYNDGFSILDYPYQIIYYPDREGEKFEYYNLNLEFNGVESIKGMEELNNKMKGLKKKLIRFALSQKNIDRRDKDNELTEQQKDMLKSLGYL